MWQTETPCFLLTLIVSGGKRSGFTSTPGACSDLPLNASLKKKKKTKRIKGGQGCEERKKLVFSLVSYNPWGGGHLNWCLTPSFPPPLFPPPPKKRILDSPSGANLISEYAPILLRIHLSPTLNTPLSYSEYTLVLLWIRPCSTLNIP